MYYYRLIQNLLREFPKETDWTSISQVVVDYFVSKQVSPFPSKSYVAYDGLRELHREQRQEAEARRCIIEYFHQGSRNLVRKGG